MTVTPPGSPRSSPRRAAAPVAARGVRQSRHVSNCRDGGAARTFAGCRAEERRSIRASPRGVMSHADVPSSAMVTPWRGRRPVVDAEGHDPAVEPLRARAITRGSSALGRGHRRGAHPSRISALASAMASAVAKNPCARRRRWSTRARPVRDADQRADLPRVVHTELDDRDSACRAARAARAAGRCDCSSSPCSGTRGSGPTGTRPRFPWSSSCRRCR